MSDDDRSTFDAKVEGPQQMQDDLLALRRKLSELADEWDRQREIAVRRNGSSSVYAATNAVMTREIRALLAAHPVAPPAGQDEGDTEHGRVVQSGEHRGRRKHASTEAQAVSEVAGSSPAPAHPAPRSDAPEPSECAECIAAHGPASCGDVDCWHRCPEPSTVDAGGLSEVCTRCGAPNEQDGHAFCLTNSDLHDLGLF